MHFHFLTGGPEAATHWWMKYLRLKHLLSRAKTNRNRSKTLDNPISGWKSLLNTDLNSLTVSVLLNYRGSTFSKKKVTQWLSQMAN